MTKKRYAELDIAKGIGALLVITGHIQYISEGFRDFIVAFHIPLFFIIAGMLICIQEEDKKSLAKTVIKKSRSILQPYFIFSLIFIVAQYEAYRIGSTITLELVKQNIFLTCIMYGMSVLWFLGALFVGELAFLGVIKICKKWAPVCLVIWLIISCIANRYLQYFCAIHADIPHISYWMYFFQVFIRIGIIATFIGGGFYLWRLRKKVKVASWAAGIIGMIALLVTVWISRINGGVDLHFLVFNNELLYFAGAILGSVGVISISTAVKEWYKFPLLHLLGFYGKNSLIVMLTHVDTYVMYASAILVMHYNKHITDYYGNIEFCIKLFLLVAFIEAIAIFIINRFFPWMVGKERREK
ncbi:MAG: acyltransferase family protein [Lachnospiraceae bacterium]|nr:acyltransferase family protein [Lachnospiraceae bacterium]